MEKDKIATIVWSTLFLGMIAFAIVFWINVWQNRPRMVDVVIEDGEYPSRDAGGPFLPSLIELKNNSGYDLKDIRCRIFATTRDGEQKEDKLSVDENGDTSKHLKVLDNLSDKEQSLQTIISEWDIDISNLERVNMRCLGDIDR